MHPFSLSFPSLYSFLFSLYSFLFSLHSFLFSSFYSLLFSSLLFLPFLFLLIFPSNSPTLPLQFFRGIKHINATNTNTLAALSILTLSHHTHSLSSHSLLYNKIKRKKTSNHHLNHLHSIILPLFLQSLISVCVS